ncbi:MAG: ferrochelatase [Rikenellaceae bacterium]
MNKFHCLLINLGSPETCDKKGISSFLREFLMDKYVMQMAWIVRFILVNFIIIPTRAERSLGLYKRVWKSGKSPIIKNTEQLVDKIESKLLEKLCSVKVSYAMRYGESSIESKIKELSDKGVEQLLIVPMFPQFEKSTYLTAVEEVKRCIKKTEIEPIYVAPFYDQPAYISSLERSIREGLNQIEVDKMLFSYHSIPLRYLPCGEKFASKCEVEKDCSDSRTPNCKECYKYQCAVTTKMVCENIGAIDGDYEIVFQSRVGHNAWLTPSLSERVEKLPSEGVDTLAVIAPSFTADCLETISEVNIDAREAFVENGGEQFYYISALNDLDLWAKKLSKWIIEAKRVYGKKVK